MIKRKYNLGLAEGHHFINVYTDLTSYGLEIYEEVKDVKDCNKTLKKITINKRSVMIYLLKPFN